MAQDRVKYVAYQSSKGPVSDFLKRHLDNNAVQNWDQIKAELKSRFGEVVDSQHALLLLRKVKQKPQETIQVYAERLLNLGEDAFEGQDNNAMQRQLVGYFIDGLHHDYMKMKVMRENPNTFNDAITAATREQNLRKRFQLRTGHMANAESEQMGPEPMQVDHMRHRDRCHFCKKKGHFIKDCRAKKRQQQVNVAEAQPRRPLHRDSVICYNCRGVGHFARECQVPRKDRQGHSLNGEASRM